VRRPRLLLLLIVASLASPATAALPAPWVVLPWGDGPGEPGLIPGGDERPAVGPVAIAAARDRVVISDAAHRRILVLDTEGRVAEVVATPFVAVDLAILPGGGLVALDAAGERAYIRDGAGPWRAPAPPTRRLSEVAVGPDGAPWVVDSLGRARPVADPTVGAPTIARAAPLGPSAAYHATGRRADARAGEVLLWAWDEPAEVRPPGPALTLAVAAGGDLLLGAIHPLRLDARGTLHVLVERLADAPRVEVHAQVRRYDLTRGADELEPVSWLVADVAPVNRYAAVDEDGALYIMAARPEGLTVWRLPAPADLPRGDR